MGDASEGGADAVDLVEEVAALVVDGQHQR